MEHLDYCARIETEARLLRATALAAGPGAAVPTCPDWTVQRVVGHTARVFAMVIRAVRAADPSSPPPRATPAGGDFSDILAEYDARLAELLELLAGSDPAMPAWHFSPTAPRTVAFWSRRMAHEATVHRIDLQSVTGEDTGVDPDFAADGVDEVLTRLIQRWTEDWAVGELSGTVLHHAADAGRAWTTRLVPGQIPQTAPEVVTEPDASVVGLADAVYRACWGRPSHAVLTGDAALREVTRAR